MLTVNTKKAKTLNGRNALSRKYHVLDIQKQFFLAFEAVSKLQERVPIKLKMSKCLSDKINNNKTKFVNELVKIHW